MNQLRRPTDIEDTAARLRDFRSDAASEAVETFVTRRDDVFICTYTKSGTTWLQQVVHQLRSGGSMDYDDISVVVPWLESAVDAGIDPAAVQPWRPRAFKSHLTWSEAPRGGRYITAFRNPTGVLPSMYRFFEGWWFETGSVTLEDFAETLYFEGTAAGTHWSHLVDWWPHIGDDDVLALAYEDMIEAPDSVPTVVAEFLGIAVDAETMERVIHNCSRDVMNANADKFDEALLRSRRDHIWGLPPGGESLKVTPGHKVELSDAIRAGLRRRWAEIVEPALGFADYGEFRNALPDPLGVRS